MWQRREGGAGKGKSENHFSEVRGTNKQCIMKRLATIAFCVLISALFIFLGSENTVDQSFASQLGTRVIVLVQLVYRKHLIAARSFVCRSLKCGDWMIFSGRIGNGLTLNRPR
jgi:energy-converting hydrogenase Eha subunit B